MKSFIHLVTILAATILPVSQLRAESPSSQPSSNPAPLVQKIKLQEFQDLLKDKDAVILDVRTPKEFAAGHVPGAINLDWHARDFADRVAKLEKSKKYLVHCLAGGRSAAATRRMAEIGFPHLYDYSGGWSEYSKAGLPVEK